MLRTGDLLLGRVPNCLHLRVETAGMQGPPPPHTPAHTGYGGQQDGNLGETKSPLEAKKKTEGKSSPGEQGGDLRGSGV